MLQNFKTYQLALQFHRECASAKVRVFVQDQLNRSSSSIVLNIAEGSGKVTAKDKRKFYAIALGSLRESMAALQLSDKLSPELANIGNQLGACLYRLCHPK